MPTRSRSRSRSVKKNDAAANKPETMKKDAVEKTKIKTKTSFFTMVGDFVMYLQSGREPPSKEKIYDQDDKQPVLYDNGLRFGVSLFSEIMKVDPASTTKKWISLILTGLCLCTVPFMCDLLQYLTNETGKEEFSMLSISSVAFNLTEEQIQAHAIHAISAFTILLVAHFSGIVHWPKHWYDSKTNKYATSCYDEMFAEPLSSTQRPVLISRLGNTISNWFYLLLALCVTHSNLFTSWESNPYSAADLLFGVNLCFLSLFSVLWHATNYNKVHYLDLWAMDHAILYLIMRNVAMLLSVYMEQHLLQISRGLLVFYFATFALAFKSYIHESLYMPYGAGMFDKGFIPSGRRRLTKVDAKGNPDMLISGTCLFFGLPVIYMFIPTLVMVTAGHTGSKTMLRLLSTSLTIGWSYRMSERFCVDGNVIMGFVNGRLEDSKVKLSAVEAACLRLIGAVASPTAVLHWLTGVCLFAGYVHCRMMDQGGK